MIYKAVQIIENCNENDKKLILEEEDNFCRPILFQFKGNAFKFRQDCQRNGFSSRRTWEPTSLLADNKPVK